MKPKEPKKKKKIDSSDSDRSDEEEHGEVIRISEASKEELIRFCKEVVIKESVVEELKIPDEDAQLEDAHLT